jgi:hypothetical protein
MIRTVRSADEERSAAVRQAAASDLPLHGCPHMTTSAMDDQETFGGDENDEQENGSKLLHWGNASNF